MKCRSPKLITLKPEPGFSGGEQVQVRCGVCKECRLRRQALWVGRMLLEQRSHQACHFLTLTYSDEHQVGLQDGYRDVQLFLKRLRKRLPQWSIRFFCCGELGKQFRRPHWHLIVFTDLPNLRSLAGKKGVTWETLGLPRPKFVRPVDLVTEVWGRGYTKTERIIDDAKLRYVTKYMVKGPEEALFRYSQGLGALRAYQIGKQVARYSNEPPVVLKIGTKSYPIAGSTRRALEKGILAGGQKDLALTGSRLDKYLKIHTRLQAASWRTDAEKEEAMVRYFYEGAVSEISPFTSPEALADLETPSAFHRGYPEIPGRAERGPGGVTREESDAYIAKADGCYDWPHQDGSSGYVSERGIPYGSRRDSPSIPFEVPSPAT